MTIKKKLSRLRNQKKMDDSETQSGGVFADIFPAEWAADGEFCEYLAWVEQFFENFDFF